LGDTQAGKSIVGAFSAIADGRSGEEIASRTVAGSITISGGRYDTRLAGSG
jgi:hypothetical protein